MTLKHKEYVMGFKISEGIVNYKYPILNKKRYSGKGRPLNADYDHFSLVELQEQVNCTLNKRLDDCLF